jgi:hypothetical protein
LISRVFSVFRGFQFINFVLTIRAGHSEMIKVNPTF